MVGFWGKGFNIIGSQGVAERTSPGGVGGGRSLKKRPLTFLCNNPDPLPSLHQEKSNQDGRRRKEGDRGEETDHVV